MKLLLIAPASGKWRHVGRSRWFSGKTFRFSLLSLLSVAAETPKDVQVRLVDEQVEDIPWNESFDLVGITCMTALAPRAYEIADRFRVLGTPVVLGGMHPTFLPEEALLHADAVVVGEAEGIWEGVIADARAGRMHGIYQGGVDRGLAGLKHPPHHLLKGKHYATVHAVQATRGCPHQCAFCAVSAFNHGTQRQRPVDEVVQEVSEIPHRFFIFVDDNLTADREYAMSLFRALQPLNKLWVTQSTLGIARDKEMIVLAAKAGCVGLFVGLETFTEKNLTSVNKTCHQVEEYQHCVSELHRHGIGVEAGIVLGMGYDTPGTFEKTLEVLEQLQIDAIQVSVFTPVPGTPQYQTMQSKITDHDWAHYDFHHVVFQPEGLSAEALQAGHDWLTQEFYKPWRILRRLVRHMTRPRALSGLPFVASVNFAYLGRVLRWGIKGFNPAYVSAKALRVPERRLETVKNRAGV